MKAASASIMELAPKDSLEPLFEPRLRDLRELTVLENLAIGAFGGALETTLQMPILTYKFCLQEGRQLPTSMNGWYRGLGVQASTVAPITALQFMTNDVLQQIVISSKPAEKRRQELTDVETMCTAAGAGAISAIVYSPVDLLTIQQQKMQLNLGGTLQALWRSYGIAGLFRGFTACASREAVYTAGYLGLAPVITKRLTENGGAISEHPLMASIAGACIAGTTAGLITHPIDTVKTVLQSDMNRVEWKTAPQAFSKLMQTGGVPSLYRGVVPRTVRLCGAFFVCLMVRDIAIDLKSRFGGKN